MTATVRFLMAFIAASFSACLVALVLAGDGPVDPVPVAITWSAVAICLFGVALWTWRWPTRAQSVAFGLVTNTAIALACLAFPNPLAALLGCIAFATNGAYLAFFHSTQLVLYNFAVAAAVGVTQATRVALDGHVALAAVDLWLVAQINIAMPLSIHILVRALGRDLVHADLDPLTGLLNRRAFHHKTLRLLMTRPADHRYLVMGVVDLDDFKAINDAHGHTVGDLALVDVALALRIATGDTAVIARSGGEEFLIADTSPSCNPAKLAQRICDAVAAQPARVTASVGTACAPFDNAPDDAHTVLVDQLIEAADAAMYQAKRNGGNQSHHHGAWTPSA